MRRVFLVGAVGCFVVLGAACEDKAIGRQCDVATDKIDPLQAVFNDQALECPTRLCIKPAVQNGNTGLDTDALCTAECSTDDDCEGQSRGKATDDKRCRTGFTCGVAFEVGPLCCKKLCLCRDFLPVGAPPLPRSCDPKFGGPMCTTYGTTSGAAGSGG